MDFLKKRSKMSIIFYFMMVLLIWNTASYEKIFATESGNEVSAYVSGLDISLKNESALQSEDFDPEKLLELRGSFHLTMIDSGNQRVVKSGDYYTAKLSDNFKLDKSMTQPIYIGADRQTLGNVEFYNEGNALYGKFNFSGETFSQNDVGETTVTFDVSMQLNREEYGDSSSQKSIEVGGKTFTIKPKGSGQQQPPENTDPGQNPLPDYSSYAGHGIKKIGQKLENGQIEWRVQVIVPENTYGVAGYKISDELFLMTREERYNGLQSSQGAGGEYIDGSLEIQFSDGGSWMNMKNMYQADFEKQSNGTFELTFPNNFNQKKVNLRYKTTIPVSLQNGANNQDITNQVWLFAPNEQFTGASDVASVAVQETTLEKKILNEGSANNDGEIEWQVEYRPLDKNYKNPILVDTLPTGIELATDSSGRPIVKEGGKTYLRIEEYEPPSAEHRDYKKIGDVLVVIGDNVLYNATTRELTFKIKNASKAYKFIYVTDIAGDGDITNRVELRSDNETSVDGSRFFRAQNSRASASIKRFGYFDITKVDAQDNKILLKGAKFMLKDSSGKNVVQEKETDENGKASFFRISFGEYILEEVEAPEGYALSKIKYSVNVVLEGGRAVTKIKELGNDKAVETQNAVTIENEKESTPPLPTKPRGEEPKDPPTKPEVPPTTPSGGTPPATPATEVPPTTPPISGGGGGTPPSIVRPDRPPTGTDIDEYGVPTQGRDRDKTKETEIGESSLPKGGKDRVQKISGAPKTGSREYNIRIMKFFATGSLLLLGMVWIKKGRRYF